MSAQNENKGSPVTVTKDEIEQKHVQADDETARFEAAFQEHWSRISGVLFRLVGDRAEAEDLALEVFWRLYQRPPRDRQNLGGWLYRVATNLGFNALRARKRRANYEEQAGQMALARNAVGDPGREFEREEERRQVRSILRQMKTRSAQLLVLRHSGLTYAELAAALDVAPASIGTLLARAEQEFAARYRKVEGE